jgi:hypothetical protein
MKKDFQVAITKSFLVSIDAEDETSALEFAEIFTSNIQDLSTKEDKVKYKFSIQEIENTFSLVQIIKQD